MKKIILRILLYSLMLSILMIVLGVGIRAYLIWPQVDLELILPGETFDSPTHLKEVPDGSGRMLVLEQKGIIKIISPGEKIADGIFLDLTHKVNNEGWEDGLLSVVFHPQFKNNRYLYLYYNTSQPDRLVVTRFRATTQPFRAEKGSETTILEIPKSRSGHNGGYLEFGKDGYLYISFGDGAEPDKSQDLKFLNGSILRIDVNAIGEKNRAYSIPRDNPFADDRNGARPEIWAYGFRNPWRFSFDRATGQLYVGDVGDITREIIHRVEPGKNYGWPVWEGDICRLPDKCVQPGFTMPLAAFPRQVIRTVIGGYVYRGQAFPWLRGHYVFAGYFRGIYSIPTDRKETIALPKTLSFRPRSTHDKNDYQEIRISSMAEDIRGELYILDKNAGIYRLVELSYFGNLVSCYPIPFGRC